MVTYTQQELLNRNKIIQSQIQFGDFLDSYIINKLIILFDKNNKSDKSIVKYIENERKLREYNNLNIEVKSEVYNIDENTPTILVKIIKNSIEFIHLSIHLNTLQEKIKELKYFQIIVQKYLLILIKRKKYILN